MRTYDHTPAPAAIRPARLVAQPPSRLPAYARALPFTPPVLQRKPSISTPDDPFEREADAVADQVMRMADPAAIGSAPLSMQRKCAACGDEEEMDKQVNAGVGGQAMQRKESAGGGMSGDLSEVIRQGTAGGGHALDANTRSFMESRFSSDFSAVRIHTGADAAQSARSVSAIAYTVGRDIVFGASAYAPHSDGGRRLLAHELTHTIQQAGGPSLGMPTIARTVAARTPPPAITTMVTTKQRCSSEPVTIQRQGMGEVHVAEQLAEERRIESARRSAAGALSNMAGRILLDSDVASAVSAAPGAVSPGRITPGIRAGRFVLHDTASPVSATRIAEHAAHGSRSRGEGAAAWVPTAGAATISHPSFFTSRRPAATQFERGEDVMTRSAREAGYRAVWVATTPAIREAALDAVLSRQGSPPSETATERATALRELGATSGAIHSAGAWAVEDICGSVSMPESTPTAQETACLALVPLHSARRSRISTTTNVEIVQARGSDCRTTGTLTVLPPYTVSQYQNVMQLYLRAALEARFFPEITTHFLIDRTAGDHCDPRCFNVTELYRLIASALGHPLGSTYGITPIYGPTAPSNVWWNNTVCGGAPP